MVIDINAIVRKMVLLGIPLLPLGCDTWGSSCPDSEKPRPSIERELTFSNPNRSVLDGGMPSAAEQEAFRKCVEEGQCLDLCRMQESLASSCILVGGDAGVASKDTVIVRATIPPALCEGRRPDCDRAGPIPEPRHAPTPLGHWLARAAYLERRSVPAFERLADELAAHRAPDALTRSARQAAREERRHERIMTSLARRFGAHPPRAGRSPRLSVRPLAAMARENAAEGCVRETLGAVIACWQSTWAGDRHIRAAMQVIARDEARHAQLAWQVHGWADTRLPPTARRALAATLAAEAHGLRAELAGASEQPAALIEAAGFPSATAARQMAAATQALLWSTAARA